LLDANQPIEVQQNMVRDLVSSNLDLSAFAGAGALPSAKTQLKHKRWTREPNPEDNAAG